MNTNCEEKAFCCQALQTWIELQVDLRTIESFSLCTSENSTDNTSWLRIIVQVLIAICLDIFIFSVHSRV